MRIGFLCKRKDACWYYRVMLPKSHLAQMGHEIKDDLLELVQVCKTCKQAGLQERNLYDEGDWRCAQCGAPFPDAVDEWRKRVKDLIYWADLVVFQRPTDIQHLRLMRELKEKNKPVLFEADDNYIDVPDWNTGHKYYTQRQAYIAGMLKEADALTVTTQPLKERYREFNKNIFVLPNSLDLEVIDVTAPLPEFMTYELRRKHDPKVPGALFNEMRKGKKVIGWGGSPTHEKDLEIILNPMRKLFKEEKNVLLVLVGFVHRQLLEIVPQDKLFVVGIVPVMHYISLYKALHFDVGLAPVVENAFNAGKSALKVLEYHALKIPSVASDYITYRNHISKSFLANNKDEEDWYKKIRQALDGEDREIRVDANRKFVEKKFDIKNNANLWDEAYRYILENK